MKTNFELEVRKLNNVIGDLEKIEKSVVEQLSKYKDGKYCEYLKELEAKRKQEFEKLKLSVFDITDHLKEKQERLKKNKLPAMNGLKLDLQDRLEIDTFKDEMINLQNNIQNLKIKSKTELENLEKEALLLSNSLVEFENYLTEWSQPLKVPTKEVQSKTKTKSEVSKETKEFMDFVHKSGGHENGWLVEDHLLFLKLYSKYKNMDVVTKYLCEILPDISKEVVKNHGIWYKKYATLRNKHKQAIQKWKAANNSVKNTASVDKNVDTTKPSTKPKSSSSTKKNKENVKEKLKQWKEEKIEKLQNAQLSQNYVEKQKRINEIEKRKQMEKIKEILKQWKNSRNINSGNKDKKSQNKKLMRAKEANKLIKMFQQQDNKYIQKRKMSLEKVAKAVSPPRPKTSCEVKRNPNRLFMPTQQWINRICDKQKFEPQSMINVIPKLHKPEWRRSLDII